eukprot:CAMPEP_0196595204 /NCGR_PEP_ID=MMETSP1081-20130531/80472_1 /TAXON_ID=36882 /ORGANISM="Pyramimonas amylifera, Strain CCMP720" /LENGTH=33 /DNA_ID= /DNA_START= /DNA_END= /DNA_ORIENTATION=
MKTLSGWSIMSTMFPGTEVSVVQVTPCGFQYLM